MNTDRRLKARIATGLAVTALLTSCGHAAPPPPPPPAHTAGVALQYADDQFRSGFKDAVSMNATNFGGMPCDKACWTLTHLEKDDLGYIQNAYKAATDAYASSTETAPKELEQWKAAITTVQADIQAWGDKATMTKGVVTYSDALQAKTFADLDKADALINTFAPASVRATPAASGN